MRGEIVYGFHVVSELLGSAPERVLRVLYDAARRDGRMQELLRVAESLGLSAEAVAPQTLERLSAGGAHQGVAAEIRPRAPLGEHELDTLAAGADALLLILDGVQDPQNLGACLRSAEAAGASAVVIPRDRASPITPAVRKAASGAAERVPVVTVANLARALERLQGLGVWVVGASGDVSASLYQAELTGPVALVLGAEQKGLRRLTRAHCDLLVRIPMQGAVASLNVSAAAAVCLFEAVRQRSVRQSVSRQG